MYVYFLEQRERELKGFSKKQSIDARLDEKHSLLENSDDRRSPTVTDKKKTAIDKKTTKEKKKKVKVKTPKTVIAETTVAAITTDNGGTCSFKRNLRPRRPSTMLDDYIMTDSEEDLEKSEPVTVLKKCEPFSKPSSKTAAVGDYSVPQKIKFSTEESAKKNLKINKTDLKPKKDFNKIDSDTINKKSLSETKSKSILLKRHKELEIKNTENTATDKKIEKSSKNKTEPTPVFINVELKTAAGECSKNAGKKVSLSNKLQQQQQLARKENASNKKKSTLDLYNNNNYNSTKKLSTGPPSSTSSSMLSGITSQTREELLERMAVNFEAKSPPAACRLQDEEKSSKKPATTTASVKVENNSAVVETNFESGKTGKNSPYSAVTVDRQIKSSAVVGVDNNVQNGAGRPAVSGGSASVTETQQGDNNVAKKETVAACDAHNVKLELEVSKTENVAQSKEENVVIAVTTRTGKMENIIMVVDKVEKTESPLLPYCNKVDKVEKIVFQSLAKDLFLQGHQKEIKITMPEYLSGNNYQMSNRFKQDDGLSVLSEICSALPRFNEPYVSNKQLLFNNKLPAVPVDGGCLKYAHHQHCPTLVPVPLANGVADQKTDEKLPVFPLPLSQPHPQSLPPPPPPPPSFESRTVKIVNLARGGNNSSAGTVVGTSNDRNDLTKPWKHAFKSVKLPKNGLSPGGAAVVSPGNNSVAWGGAKRIQLSNDNQTPSPKTRVEDEMNNKTITARRAGEGNPMKATVQSAVLANGAAEKKSFEHYSYSCQKTCCRESKTAESFDGGKKTPVANNGGSYLAKTTILNSTKYDLKFEKRSAAAAVPMVATTATPVTVEKHHRKDAAGDVSSSEDQSPEKKIFNQRRLSTNQSCSGNSSDAFSPDNETSVYAFQPDLPVASTPFRRNKPQSPAKSRTVSPNTSIAVSVVLFLFFYHLYETCTVYNALIYYFVNVTDLFL